MKWCVDFPEETVLVVRPSLKRICLGFKPAGKLLSTLLYRVSIRKEAKEDAENLNGVKVAQGQEADQDTSLRIYRTQAQLVADMVDEMDEKTLHDTAVPTLQLLGYLDIEEHPGCNCYIVHLDAVQQALRTLKEQKVQLEKFLITHLQLEKFLIDPQLEKFLIDKKKFVLNKKYFLLQLEKVRIANRNISNCKRGRKPASQASAEGQNEVPQNLKDNKEILESNRENISGAIAPSLSESSLHVSLDELSQQTYEKAVEFLTPHGAIEEVKASHTPAETIILAQKLYDEGFRQDGYHVEVTCAFCGEMAHAFCCQCEQLFCKQHLAIIPTEPEDRNTFCPSCFEKRNQTAPLAQKVPEPEPPQQQQHAAPTQRRSAKKEPPQAAWTARAMVAKAEALRERPYTDKQRPKELKAAQKLLEQKPDITPEEFERVFNQRNDAWWREHNGPLNVTDLAATPKDKNDLRYMLVLAQIQREAERKKPPSDQKVAAPPAPVRPLVADSSSVAQIQAMRARKMAERAQSQGGR